MDAFDSYRPTLTKEQQKALLDNTRYHTTSSDGRRIFGRRIGFGEDHRGFGAVVGFPGHKSFFVVNPATMQVECKGAPPVPKAR